jgi:3',5'-cyclic-AMP phosphodiesterase
MSPFEIYSRLDLRKRELTRRGFGRRIGGAAAALAGSALTGPALLDTAWAAAGGAKSSSRYFYFAVIADTHIIDEFYKGPESNPLDTESIFKTTERLVSARSLINSLHPPMERVFLVGDYFHNYPSADWDFYFKNKTRVDRCHELTGEFKMPVHACFGNHDYDVPRVSREFSHRLFKEKFGLDPYYSLDYKGWKFIHLNNFIGDTWKPGSATYNKEWGSLGEQQLNWFEAELDQRKPTFVFIHFPLYRDVETEVADYGIGPLLKKHRDTIQRVVSGHWHKWYDFARTYGPPHYVIGATRYDENAYMLVEADMLKQTHRFLNVDCVDWATHYSKPYKA